MPSINKKHLSFRPITLPLRRVFPLGFHTLSGGGIKKCFAKVLPASDDAAPFSGLQRVRFDFPFNDFGMFSLF